MQCVVRRCPLRTMALTLGPSCGSRGSRSLHLESQVELQVECKNPWLPVNSLKRDVEENTAYLLAIEIHEQSRITVNIEASANTWSMTPSVVQLHAVSRLRGASAGIHQPSVSLQKAQISSWGEEKGTLILIIGVVSTSTATKSLLEHLKKSTKGGMC